MNKMILHMGARGEYVRYLNSILKDLEYKISNTMDDFDLVTKYAVEAFQNDNYLTVNGIVDQRTWDKLEKFHSLRYPNKEVISVMKQLTEKNNTPDDADTNDINDTADTTDINDIDQTLKRSSQTIVLREGSKGSEVIRLQQKLKSLGFLTGNADGSFGSLTTKAVREFQTAAGLASDGVVGLQTWIALDNYKPPVVVPPTDTTSRPVLREGSSGEYVVALQKRLKELGFLSGNADGNFGPLTSKAVRDFQNAAGLSSDGVVGQQTWIKLDTYKPDVITPPPNTTSRPVLREGSSGEYVAALQKRLKELGFYNGAITSIYGSETKDAVIKFQQSKGLVADSIVGDKTWDALNINDSDIKKRPVIREGATGEDVLYLQAKLKELGYYNGDINGIFNAATTDAVKEFQKYAGLISDGVVGEKTWIQLDVEILPPSKNPVIKEGSTGEYVKILQQKLLLLNYYFASVTGSFDSVTTKSVIAFQKDNGISPDGIVGAQTWEKLYAATPPPTEVVLPPGPKPTLRYGDTGAFVKFLQSELTKLLYYKGPISGEFDWQTEIAVKSFQDVSRLTADGVVGRSTWNALYSLLPPPVKCD